VAPKTLNPQKFRFAATCALVLLILLYFSYLVAPGLKYFFNPDDTANLFKAWIKSPTAVLNDLLYFWSGHVRPLGQLAYRTMYKAFGWNPLPFRVSCLVLLEFNLLLIILLARGLSASEPFRILVPLIAAFHGALWSIYSNTGTIYDILCLTCFLIGLNDYIRVRNSARPFGFLDSVVMAAATIAAFESKEIGFLLPAVILALELIVYFPSKPAEMRGRTLLAIIPAAVCSCLGALGIRYSDNQVFFAMDGYTPSFTLHRYGETLTTYFHLLSFKTVHFSAPGAFLCMITALVTALLLKSRVAAFGWAMFLLTLLPLSFAPPRQDGYVLYVPYVGVAIFLAAIFESGLSLSRLGRGAHSLATLATCFLVMGIQLQQRAKFPEKGFGPGGMSWVEQLSDYSSAMCSSWPPNARIAVINNPFGHDWQADFILNLACNRKDLRVDTIEIRKTENIQSGLLAPVSDYKSLALYDQDGYRNVNPRDTLSAAR
jgi:hypothetical protein